jgi:hypothetical protein
MVDTTVNISSPTFSRGGTITSAAYGIGWGYSTFSISLAMMCAVLGGADQSSEQLRLAFELNRPPIIRAVQRQAHPERGSMPRLFAACDL